MRRKEECRGGGREDPLRVLYRTVPIRCTDNDWLVWFCFCVVLFVWVLFCTGSVSYSLNDGDYHHVAVTYDGKFRKLYIDFQLVASGKPTAPNVQPGN